MEGAAHQFVEREALRRDQECAFAVMARRASQLSRGSSVVRHADGRLFRAVRARLTFSRMSAALAVQMKGFGLSL